MTRELSLAFLVLGAAPVAWAQDGFRHGRIAYLEPSVTLQRATEAGSEEAAPNLPFLPGDRVWTDARGRAEFQFRDGTFLRLNSRSKLDYAGRDEGRDRFALRLWSGALYVRARNREIMGFEIETPAGLVRIEDRGVYRIDAGFGETRLSVYEGQAILEGGRRRVGVAAGERSYVRRGDNPEPPRRFDRGEGDEFARWEAERENREAWAANSRRYLPEELDPYAGDFEAHGAWYYETEVGYVWRPYVGAGWQPYAFGHWAWTVYGWTWVPNESWGWAPFHYGRWGQSASLGWYWIPGNVWGPAWVSWALGGDTVGWCPLGYRDRPVVELGAVAQAVPRGSLTAQPRSGAWTYARREDMGARDLARRRIDPALVKDLRVVDQPRARPSRDFRAVEGEGATPRNIRVRPTPGDTVPELKTDHLTTIPAPVVRGHPLPVTREDQPRYDQRAGEAARPRDQAPRRIDKGEAESPDRDVLRPMFQPLSEPRSRSGEEGARSRDDGSAPSGEERGGRSREEGSAHPSGEGGGARRPPANRPPARPATPGPDRAVPRPPPKKDKG